MDSESTRVQATEQEVPAEPKPPESTFLDSVTVTATRGPATLEDVAGATVVIDDERIERELMTDVQDLVRYEPGVYVDNDVTRLGLNGFNIRGIGGNRVLTQIDGIPTAEQFDFGPFTSTQFQIDLESLRSVEIVKSAGSSLYGSDALGGVVSLLTKRPADYLVGRGSYLGLTGGFDGRDDETYTTFTGALGSDRWQGSITATLRDGAETDNQGDITTHDSRRTAPNPIDRDSLSVLGKVFRSLSDSNQIGLSVEYFDSEASTSVLTSQQIIDFSFVLPPGGSFLIDVADVDAIDTQERQRVSLEQNLITGGSSFLDSLSWRAYLQESSTEQQVLESRFNRVSFGGPPSVQQIARDGLLTFDQDSFGGELQIHKELGSSAGGGHLLTYGGSLNVDTFSVFRDRLDIDVDTGEVVESSLVFPTSYFPQSDVEEIGLFAQVELRLADGRLSLVPGVRWDSYDLDPDGNDRVFLDGNPGQPAPVGLSDSELSPKLGVIWRVTDPWSVVAQYAGGFRAPPYSSVNNGFTNQAGGYTTLPNPDLQPETSDNLEIGVRRSGRRGAFSLTWFENRFDDFIETTTLGVNLQTGLLELQPQNVDEVSIRGVELATDLRIGTSWQLRSAFAWIEGDKDTDDVPLGSIAPPRLVLGLTYNAPGGRWGGSLVTTAVDSKSVDELADPGHFAPPSYQLVDLTGFFDIGAGLSVQAGVFNLLDEEAWDWSSVRGRAADSPVIDRYTSPGVNAAVSLRYRR